ncbi:MAG: hypothetical protein K6357_01740, partial [Elusimicrobiota bacterium]
MKSIDNSINISFRFYNWKSYDTYATLRVDVFVMQNFFIFRRIKGYRRAYNMLYSLKNLSESEVAKKRIKIIRFYEEYGE